MEKGSKPSRLFSLAHMSRSIWENLYIYLNKTMTDNRMRFYKRSQTGKVNVRAKIKHANIVQIDSSLGSTTQLNVGW